MAGEASVDNVSTAVAAMGREWKLLEALMGGTTSMRAQGETFLPKFSQEPQANYDARLKMSVLFPAYKRTIGVMAGKPFSRPLRLPEDAPDQLKEWCEDIDREGVNLHNFAAGQFEESFYGIAGILVEAPPKPAKVESEAEQKARGARPYWVRVHHRQILGYRLVYSNGQRSLAMLRLQDDQLKDDGAWGEKTVKRVRVLTPGHWEVHELDDTNGWKVVEQGETTLAYIPFVPLYGRRLGYMIGAPPLAELGHMNQKHWVSSSDQDNILHAARVPILFGRKLGLPEGAGLVIGAGKAVTSEEPDADLKWVEHKGEAIKAGQDSLEHLEEQMVQAGAELMVKQSGGAGKTATEDSNDAEGNKCELQRISEGFEDSLNLAISYTLELGGLTVAKPVKLSVFKDFGVANMGLARAQLIKDLMVAGKMSLETGYAELQRSGEISLDVNPQDERDRLTEEGLEAMDMATQTLERETAIINGGGEGGDPPPEDK